jgi:hypothetical protein
MNVKYTFILIITTNLIVLDIYFLIYIICVNVIYILDIVYILELRYMKVKYTFILIISTNLVVLDYIFLIYIIYVHIIYILDIFYILELRYILRILPHSILSKLKTNFLHILLNLQPKFLFTFPCYCSSVIELKYL